MDSKQLQILLTVADTLHDFGKHNNVLQDYVLSTLRGEFYMFYEHLTDDQRDTLMLHHPNTFRLGVKSNFEGKLIKLLLTEYKRVYGRDWTASKTYEWSDREQAIAQTKTNAIYVHAGIDGTPAESTMLFKNPSELAQYVRTVYRVPSNRKLVVDRGSQLKEDRFFCKVDPPTVDGMYVGIASQYDRATTAIKPCQRREFQTYGITQEAGELLSLSRVQVAYEAVVEEYLLEWSRANRHEIIDIEHVITSVVVGGVRMNYLTLFQAAVNQLQAHVKGQQSNAAITGLMEQAALAIIKERYKLTINPRRANTLDLEMYVRSLYDLKRCGDYLQAKAVFAANSSPGSDSTYVFVTNDRLAAIYAALLGVPCMRTISEKVKGSTTNRKMDKYIEFFNFVPSNYDTVGMPHKKILEGLLQSRARVVVKIADVHDDLKREWDAYLALQRHGVAHHSVEYMCYFRCNDNIARFVSAQPSICRGEGDTMQVLVMEYAGKHSMDTYDWGKADIAVFRSCLKQVLIHAVQAFEACGFVHGDFHLNNVLMKPCAEKQAEYRVYGKTFLVPIHGFWIKRMDYEFSRVGVKDPVWFYRDVGFFLGKLLTLERAIDPHTIMPLRDLVRSLDHGEERDVPRILDMIPMCDGIQKERHTGGNLPGRRARGGSYLGSKVYKEMTPKQQLQ